MKNKIVFRLSQLVAILLVLGFALLAYENAQVSQQALYSARNELGVKATTIQLMHYNMERLQGSVNKLEINLETAQNNVRKAEAYQWANAFYHTCVHIAKWDSNTCMYYTKIGLKENAPHWIPDQKFIKMFGLPRGMSAPQIKPAPTPAPDLSELEEG